MYNATVHSYVIGKRAAQQNVFHFDGAMRKTARFVSFLFRSSSMVEQFAVNEKVAGSSPASGATY